MNLEIGNLYEIDLCALMSSNINVRNVVWNHFELSIERLRCD